MLLRNTIYNLIGLGAPLLVAVVSIPLLIAALGIDRFGLLTLIWAVVSYFGLFDLGLGRALTQELAVLFDKADHDEVGSVVATATLLMAVLGVLAGVLMAIAAPWGVSLIRSVPNRHETVSAVYAMAMAMPAIVLTSGFRGILEAKHAFGTINLIRLPMGLFTFLGPLAVVTYGQPRLDWIAWTLAAGRVAGCVVHAWFAFRVLPADHGHMAPRRKLVRSLGVTGGWLSLSNVISPFMGYVDRFVIGAIVSAAAVAYYVTPQELVTKLWIVPGALTAVLFPTFAAQLTRRDAQTWVLFGKAIHGLWLVLLPITLALALFARELVSAWIGHDFANHSAVLLQIFAFGILINCLAHVPFTLVQSAGASRATALVHCAELPFFLALLWWSTGRFGVTGAAVAWLVRIGVDTLLMFALSMHLSRRPSSAFICAPVVLGAMLTLLAFAGVLLPSILLRGCWLAVAVATVTAAAFRSLRATGPAPIN